MNKCLLLFKIQLLGFMGINRLRYDKSKTKSDTIWKSIGMLLLLLMVLGYSIAIAVGYAAIGMVDALPPLMLIVCAVATIMFTFFISNGVLFGFKDYDMVMSLPVTSGAVIASRLLLVYIVDFFAGCVFMIPSMLVFGIEAKATLSVWIMMGISLFLAPLIPIIVAMVVGAAITAISIRFKHSNLVVTFLSIAAILFVMTASFRLQNTDSADFTEFNKTIGAKIAGAYPPAKLFGHALLNQSWISFCSFAAISFASAALFVLLLSITYTKINSALFSHHAFHNYRMGTLKTSTPFQALYVKEMRRLFSSSIYFLNSCIGAVLLIASGVAVLFISPTKIEQALGVPGIMASGSKIAPFVICLFVGITSTTASSISLEGKSRWIPYSSPVEPITIFKSKITVSLTILIPAVLVAGVLMAIRFETNFLQTLFMMITPVVFSFFVSVLGLVFNLKFPKYDWTSEAGAVKQSMSVLATTGVAMLFALAILGISFVFIDYSILLLCAVTLFVAAITWIMVQKLKKVKLYV
ncbi:hypothetical protein LQZ18_09630 [Lachnospiraceae bacterium ZAX-1]